MIAFPITDILTAVKFADQTFTLQSRQELSRQASGSVRGKDFGSALWVASYTTVPIPNDDAVAYEAKLNSLDGVIFTFEARDLRRVNPRSKPLGDFADSGVLHTVDPSNKAMRLDLLPSGFVLSPGDYLSFTYDDSRALHQVVEGATASVAGLTPLFEVRPHIRPGWTLATPVKLKAPSGLFSLNPNSVQARLQDDGLHTIINFQATQYL